jgi:hypothetical protein
MSKRALEWYQYVAPAVLTPLSFWLWWRYYDGDIWLVLVAWLLPILYAYIVPGVGTNVLRVWEFDTALRLGRFRPHHGFVFGSATAAIAWLVHGDPADGFLDIVRLSVVLASVLGFWNLLYDVKAIEARHLRVYNQPWADGKPAESVAMDYAPWFFAGFGAIYGAGIGVAELLSKSGRFAAFDFAWLFPLILILSIGVPVWGYRRRSFRRYGHSGCRPVERNTS